MRTRLGFASLLLLLALAAPAAQAENFNPTLINLPTDSADVLGGGTDGSRVVFSSGAALAGDADSSLDLFAFAGGATTWLSGPSNSPGDMIFDFVSRDARHVVFSTNQSLVGFDTNGQYDVYESFDGGAPVLVSQSDGVGVYVGPSQADFDGATPDGTRIFFHTQDSLTADDDNPAPDSDVYERRGGTTTLISQPNNFITQPDAQGAQFQGTSDDGAHVWFTTTDQMTDGQTGGFDTDVDDAQDVYERFRSGPDDGGSTLHLSRGNSANAAFWRAANAAGTHVAISTRDNVDELPDDDGDSFDDVYAIRPGQVSEIASVGPSGNGGNLIGTFARVSENGRFYLFWSGQPLTPDDTDNAIDYYVRDLEADTTELVSGTLPSSNLVFYNFSLSGRRVLFSSNDAMLPEDTDNNQFDTYLWDNGTLKLITNTDRPTSQRAANRDVSRIYFETDASLTGDDTDGGVTDVFMWKDGAISLVSRSPAPTATNPAGQAILVATTESDVVLFKTSERMTPNDTDSTQDIYAAAPGPVPVVTGPGPGTGTTPGGGGVPDKIAPIISGLKPILAKLRAALSKGLKVRLGCNERCTVEIVVTIDAKTAKRAKLGKKTTVVARGKGTINAGRTTTVTVKFTAKAKKALRKLSKVKLKIKVTVTDAAGNKRSSTRTVTLRR